VYDSNGNVRSDRHALGFGVELWDALHDPVGLQRLSLPLEPYSPQLQGYP
jgi:hypothetical protein